MNIFEIRKWFEVIKGNNQLTEVRILAGKKTYSGYFSNADDIIKALMPYDNYNIYFTLNQVVEACGDREQSNKIVLSPKATTSDNNIFARDWVLIDLDPKRPSDTNATNEEKIKTQKVVNKIYSFLRGVGFTSPVIADSSNGYHLLYKVAMKNSPENTELVKDFLNALSIMFSDNEVEVDTSVYNASRICKVYGTRSRKGSNTKTRPQRLSGIIRVPSEIKETPIALFRQVVDMIPKPERATYSNHYNPVFNIDEFLQRNSIRVDKEMQVAGARKILLKECPFDSNHKSPDSAIFVLNNGAIGFKCFHNSCSHHTWADLRDMYEPKKEYVRDRSIQPMQSKPQKVDERGDKFLNLIDIESIDRSKIITIPSKLEELDRRIIGFNLGDVSLWSGNNASGKSTILGQLGLSSVQAGFPVALFSGELTPNRVKNWIQQQAAGRQYTKKSGFADAYYVPTMVGNEIDVWLKDRFLVYNNKYGNKILSLLADLKEVIDKGVKCIILDNLMSIDILEMQGDKFSKQSSTIQAVVNFAKEMDVHIHIVAHPRKATGFLRKTDISGSADLTNAVDNVFIIHRVNNDFKIHAREFFSDQVASQYFNFGNVIEVVKNRDLGVMDYLVGLYYEHESRRFLNYEHENINYGWIAEQQELPIGEFPLGEDFDLPE